MADKNETLKLIRMNEVEATEIDWLWYPYIPYGKITVIQGDPSDGKTTVVLGNRCCRDNRRTLPESKTVSEPMISDRRGRFRRHGEAPPCPVRRRL